MYSFHLTGSPWFLLLLLPGLWILWRAFTGAGRGGRLLFFLQAAALFLLALSLAGPELRKHNVRFHDPAILILRDQSASFRAGAALGLGGRYETFRGALEAAYRGKRFDVRMADFAAGAWPVKGFSGASRPPEPRPGDPTSLDAAADFADSAGIPNLQAVFLFSDGRAVLDSGRAGRAWRVPVFPVVLAPDSFAEVQPLRAGLDENGVEIAWEDVGRSAGDPQLRLIQAGRTVLSRALPASAPVGADGSRSFRFPWAPPKDGRGPLRAALFPAGADPIAWNDTIAVGAAAGQGARRVLVLRPVRSLDERGMLDALRAEGNVGVTFFSAEEAASLPLAPADQVWIEAGALAQPRLAAWLRTIPAKAVVYARSAEEGLAYGGHPSGPLPALGTPADWPSFTPAAEVKAAKPASEAFPDEVVRLKALTAAPLRAPVAAPGAWVEVREGGKRGMLMGRLDLGQGKRAFFFCLPAVWGELFDPQADFAVRENIAAYVRAAHALADLEDGGARASLPARAYADIPFAAEASAPEGKEAAFGLAGPGFSREWPRPSAGGRWTVKDISLAAGRYRAWVRSGADTLWRGSLEAAPREAMELARIGFDQAALADLAGRSGGSVLRPTDATVTSMLPDLPAAQIRMDRTRSIRLYNNFPLSLIVLALLALSWVLRKKWDLD
jgi:hypothetical protein